MKDHRSVQRFSHTVEHYVKYRPHYPKAVINILQKHCGLKPESLIADIGSGTGIFTQLLLENGNKVWGIEPNAEMRKAAEAYLSDYDNFVSVNASAEKTTLDNHCVDIITAAQAFHWFEQEGVKKEFKRILKNNGWLVLFWNLRDSQQPGIMQAYEQLLQKFGTDYKDVCAEGVSEQSIVDFFAPNHAEIIVLPNEQILDWEGFRGRLLSTSYVPTPNAPNYEVMLNHAESIFKQYQQDGEVKFIYQTKLYMGQL